MARLQNKLNWRVFTNKQRNEAIEDLKNAISKTDGYIINFNTFSDLALSLTVEIEEKSIHKLYQKINEVLKISESEPENLNLNSNKDWWIFINFSFGKGKGELKVNVPDVPG
ncbi:hypothetical protein G3I01_11655 [Gramella sp. MT6]|uniref:hypothetical protein n=1 Tax=Gramella sp. MT6 TaxID=2705471 RepID=UPI001C5F5DE7|nr:hypothetical protein [Gramella sp. MT6]QYA26140.1 hypothetical protein G3I01_11655 [Gramella sp. MT6]